MKISTILFLSIISFSFISCKSESTYEYCQDVQSYLKNIHNITENTEEVTYFFLSPEGCENCINLNLDLLKSSNYNVQLILIGKSYDKKRIEDIRLLKKKYPDFLSDEKSLISSYRTGFSKPMILTLKSGKCNYQLSISDFKISDAKKYLDTKFK